MSSFDPLGLRPNDPLERWRDDAERQEREFAQARRERERKERQKEQTAVDRLWVEMRRELASIRSELDRRFDVQVEAVGEAIGEYSDKVVDHVEKTIRQVESQLWVAIERRFGELMGRLDAILPDARPRSQPTKDFKFSNERDDDHVVDLPNPLRKAN
jgi:hypothetical protein